MRRYSLICLTFVVSMVVGTSGAQAVVVDMSALGNVSVPYNAADTSNYFGVALVPGARSQLQTANIPPVVSNAPARCLDPALPLDLGGPFLPVAGLCSHGGPVMHGNETFDLTWDPTRSDWATTRNYVEQFLRDVADGSGTLTSPYAETGQYTDATGRAANASRYGGGCIDLGSHGGACAFGDTTGAGAGRDYPASGCPVAGMNWFHELPSGAFGAGSNVTCLTDSQLQSELATMIVQTGLLGRTELGYTPLVVVLTPPGVETCLDAAGKLCSANGMFAPPVPTLSTAPSGGTIADHTYQVKLTYITAAGESSPSGSQTVTTSGNATTDNTSTITISSPPPVIGATGWYAYVAQVGDTSYTRETGAPTAIGADLTLKATVPGPAPPLVPPFFCSYHSQVNVGGTKFAYVVQPWTALTGCDEPDAPNIPAHPTSHELAVDVGIRLVSPLSQGQLAAIVNPSLNGWFALDGSEINDNYGCVPLGNQLDSVTVGNSSQNPYLLQREFNNGGLIETDPNSLACTPNVNLEPQFVVPSAVNRGDVVEFDGSKTVSSLIVPKAGYVWNFGDGTTAVGPSVVHSYAYGGSYAVTLTVTDRGGNIRSLSQTVDVLGSPPPLPPTPPTTPPSTTTPTPPPPPTPPTTPTPPPTPPTTTTTTTTPAPAPRLRGRLQLMPMGLRTMLRVGVSIRVTSNEPANGIVTLSISRSDAKRAHIRAGRGKTVVIGRGTTSGIKDGTVSLSLRLSRATAAKLKHLKHVNLTVRLALVAAGKDHVAIVAAGRY